MFILSKLQMAHAIVICFGRTKLLKFRRNAASNCWSSVEALLIVRGLNPFTSLAVNDSYPIPSLYNNKNTAACLQRQLTILKLGSYG